jgi:hypothetical protein
MPNRTALVMMGTLCLAVPFLGIPTAIAEDALMLRVETLTVPPATQPLLQVVAQNPGSAAWQGELSLRGPTTWQLTPDRQPLSVRPGGQTRLSFSIERGRNIASNRYEFAATARSQAGTVVEHRQQVFVASAPYFKPTIDGQLDEWKASIPITFTTAGQNTTISTYWNRREFSLLVQVQEKQLVPFSGKNPQQAFDAVQFALAPLPETETEMDSALAKRFEYLLVATEDGPSCYQFAGSGTENTSGSDIGNMKPLASNQVKLALRRERDFTIYECSLSFRPLRDVLRPSEGREFWMSVLVHDPDGTGLRDLGKTASLWPAPDSQSTWHRWSNAVFQDRKPLPPMVRWGFCASKY